jgi:prophage regulatory protein
MKAETRSRTPQHSETIQQIPEVGFLRLQQVLALYPVARSTWWAGVRAGRYPLPVKLGRRVTAWRASDIRQLIEHLG